MMSIEGDFEEINVANYLIDWSPKEDITSYELARAVPVLVSGVQGDPNKLKEWIEDLPEEVSRHFVIESR